MTASPNLATPDSPLAQAQLPGAAASPAPIGGGGGFEIRDLIRIIRHRFWTIALTSSFVFALAVGLSIFLYLFYPTFRAEAFLEVRPPEVEAFSVAEQAPDPNRMEVVVATEAAKLRNKFLLEEVLALDEIRETEFWRSYNGQFDECLEDFHDGLTAAPVRDQLMIRVAFATGDGKEAELIVNKLIERHISKSELSRKSEIASNLTDMRAAVERFEADRDLKRDEIARFRQQTDVAGIEAKRIENADVLANIRTELTGIETQVADFETQLAAIEGIPVNQLPLTAEMQAQIEADPIVRFRKEQIESNEITRQSLLRSGRFGPNHREIKFLEAQQREIEAVLVSRREQLIDETRSQYEESLSAGLARFRAIQADLEGTYGDLEAEQRDLDQNYQRLVELERDLANLEFQIGQLQAQVNQQQQLAETLSKRESVEIQQRARAPKVPSSPNLVLFVIAGFVLSVGSGFGLAFLREFADQAVRTPIDVVRHAHVPVLGTVPELDDEEADIDDIERAALDAPQSLLADVFRQIRTHLIFSGPPESQRTLLLTSPGAGCGKSSVAVNLAATLARAGERVLLIDANFRRPFLREVFPDIAETGLSNVLIGQQSVDEVLHTTDLPNLDVLAAGPMPPNPAELLGTQVLRDLLDELSSRYDRILIDGPPILLVSDAMVLAVQSDAVILVARAGSNTKGMLKRAHEQTQRIGVRVIGAILNGVKTRAGGYYKRQYRAYYDYLGDEEDVALLAPLSESRTQVIDSTSASASTDVIDNDAPATRGSDDPLDNGPADDGPVDDEPTDKPRT